MKFIRDITFTLNWSAGVNLIKLSSLWTNSKWGTAKLTIACRIQGLWLFRWGVLIISTPHLGDDLMTNDLIRSLVKQGGVRLIVIGKMKSTTKAWLGYIAVFLGMSVFRHSPSSSAWVSWQNYWEIPSNDLVSNPGGLVKLLVLSFYRHRPQKCTCIFLKKKKKNVFKGAHSLGSSTNNQWQDSLIHTSVLNHKKHNWKRA